VTKEKCAICGWDIEPKNNPTWNDMPVHDGCLHNAVKTYLEHKNQGDAEKIRDMIKELSNLVNHGHNEASLAKTMAHEFRQHHNTLEQQMIKVLQQFIVEVSKIDEWKVDARNEASIKWCKEVATIEARFPFI